MKRSQPPNPFELENLEQRILLSSDAAAGAVQAIAPDEVDLFDTGLETPPLEETWIPSDGASQNASYDNSLQYDPSQNLDDLFAGMGEEDLFVA